jgi:hypothetical protein
MKAQLNESDGRILLGDNSGGWGGHAAADQVSVCCSFDLNCTPFHSHLQLNVSNHFLKSEKAKTKTRSLFSIILNEKRIVMC